MNKTPVVYDKVSMSDRIEDFMDSLPLPRFVRYPLTVANDVKWWLLHRFHPKHRYHVLNTGLKPNYYDIDTIMLHGCMKLLDRYIEIERNGEDRFAAYVVGLEEDLKNQELSEYEKPLAEQVENERIALDIYRWWHDREAAWNKNDEDYEKNHDIKAHLERERELWNEDEKRLTQLVKIRTSLWT
jgi:hypothetical protein